MARALAEAIPLPRLHPRVVAWGTGAAASRRRWAVALSGGADSVALLLLIWAHWPQHRDRLVALHFNHRLRGGAAADVRFCRSLTRALGVPLEVGEWQNAPAAASEAAARAARHDFFHAQLRRRRAAALWLGHQQDDVAETLLMRLARGSGTAGLAAPRPVQAWTDGTMRLRPLLTLSAGEVRAQLQAARGRWCEDETNATAPYFRNRLRATVIPSWQEAAGRDAVAGAALSRERLEEDDEALQRWVEELAPFAEDGTLRLGPLVGRPLAVWRRALQRWLLQRPHQSDLSRHGFEDLLSKALLGKTTRFSLGATGFIRIRAGRMSFEP